MTADRVFIRKPGARAAFIDHHYPGRVFRVGVSEIATAQKGNARGLKIPRRDVQLPHVVRILELFRFRLAFENEACAPAFERHDAMTGQEPHVVVPRHRSAQLVRKLFGVDRPLLGCEGRGEPL